MFRGQSLGRLWIPLVALESLLATRREVLGSLWSRHTWAAWAALVRPLKIFKFLIMYLKIIPIEQVLSHLISTWEASIIFTCNFKHTNFLASSRRRHFRSQKLKDNSSVQHSIITREKTDYAQLILQVFASNWRQLLSHWNFSRM